MTKLNQLILELSRSVMEIPPISFAGICLLNTLNLQVEDIVIAPGALALIYSIIHVKTGQITSMLPVAGYINPMSHFRILLDVIHHPCDLVIQKAQFQGESMKPYIEVCQKIPKALNSKPINNPTNKSNRSP